MSPDDLACVAADSLAGMTSLELRPLLDAPPRLPPFDRLRWVRLPLGTLGAELIALVDQPMVAAMGVGCGGPPDDALAEWANVVAGRVATSFGGPRVGLPMVGWALPDLHRDDPRHRRLISLVSLTCEHGRADLGVLVPEDPVRPSATPR